MGAYYVRGSVIVLCAVIVLDFALLSSVVPEQILRRSTVGAKQHVVDRSRGARETVPGTRFVEIKPKKIHPVDETGDNLGLRGIPANLQ